MYRLLHTKQIREDRIAKLQEALTMTQALGIESPADINKSGKVAQGTMQNEETPLFYRGAQALTQEIDILNNRKDDSPHAAGLRELQEKLSLYQNSDIDPSQISAARVDAWAYPAASPAEPKNKIILAIASILGFSVSFFLLFVWVQLKPRSV